MDAVLYVEGIITAGALWIELHDPSEFETNVNKLASAIYNSLHRHAAVGTGGAISSSDRTPKASGVGDVHGGANTHNAEHAEEPDDEESVFSVAEMRGELVRLAVNLGDNKAAAAGHAAELGESIGKGSDFGSMRCTLPAGVPTLPQQVRITTEMKQLLTNVLTFDGSVSKQQGFCGMAGRNLP